MITLTVRAAYRLQMSPKLQTAVVSVRSLLVEAYLFDLSERSKVSCDRHKTISVYTYASQKGFLPLNNCSTNRSNYKSDKALWSVISAKIGAHLRRALYLARAL